MAHVLDAHALGLLHAHIPVAKFIKQRLMLFKWIMTSFLQMSLNAS
jgi:hypothetical protein